MPSPEPVKPRCSSVVAFTLTRDKSSPNAPAIFLRISSINGGNGLSIPFLSENPMLIFVLAPGGFFVFGCLMAIANRLAEGKGMPKAELHGCENCPMAKSCAIRDTHESCEEKKEAEA